jgi:polar amino acid transport system substrate-binding protein
MFKAGRFQAMIGSPLVYASYLRDSEVRVEDWFPGSSEERIHLLLSKRSTSDDDARRWGDLISTIVADGTMLRLLEKYLPPAEAAQMLLPTEKACKNATSGRKKKCPGS